jgi:phosphorylase kinase alpha/beta subunit
MRSNTADSLNLVSEFQPMIECQLRILERMIEISGAVSASPNGPYSKAHWVRDGLYVLIATAYVDRSDLVDRLIRAHFTVFRRHSWRLVEGIRHKPDPKKCFPAVYTKRFEEIRTEWGQNQLDTIGLFLYLVACFRSRGMDVFQHSRRFEEKVLLNKITRYAETMEWWSARDFGQWEEGPERHASSIGAVLAGLRMLSTLKDDELYFNEAQMNTGRRALDALLPKESPGRECDLAQLSLIWPFGILSDEQLWAVLDRIEKKLARPKGLIRYERDAYFNAKDPRLITFADARTGLDLIDYRDEDRTHFRHDVQGSEAQWPLGLAWLSIVYSKLAKQRHERGEDHAEHMAKARHYLEQLKSCAVPADGMAMGYVPELYVDGRPNVNTPLTWATAMSIIAAVAFTEIEDRDVPYSAL